MVNWWVRLRYILPIKALIILFVIILVSLPIICWNLQYSAFFIQGDLNYAGFLKRTLNNRRIAEARYYFSQKPNKTLFYQSNSLKIHSSNKKYPNIVIMVIAVDRNRREIDYYQPSYLIQTMHKLFKSVERDKSRFGDRFFDINTVMCNIDNKPYKFYEFQYLTKYFHNLNNVASFSTFKNNQCKARVHFLSCLQLLSASYQHNNYFVVLEDDLVARNDAIDGLAQIFDSLSKRFSDRIKDKLSFVQLYYPINEVKFGVFDPSSWLEILLLSLPLLFLLIIFYFRLHLRPMFLFYNVTLLAILWSICALFVVLIGRPHWLSLFHSFTLNYNTRESTSESTAAVLLTREFLNTILAPGIDYNCNDDKSLFELMKSLAGDKRILSTNINLFNHIGLYSSIKKATLNPYIVE